MDTYEIPQEKRKLLPMFDRFESVTQDHSATQVFRKCPRKYFYAHVLGFRQKDEPPYFSFGSAYHKFRDELELEYNKLESTKRTDTHALQSCTNRAMERALNSMPNDPPLGSRWDFLSRGRLLDSCLLVSKRWIAEKQAKKIEVIATEQPVNILLELSDKSHIIIGGRIDQIVRVNGQLWGRDFKTTSKPLDYYERRVDPNEQFIRYTVLEEALAGERIYGQIVEVLYNNKESKTARAKTSSGPEVRAFTVSFTTVQLDEWKRDQEYWNKQLKYARDNDHYPKSYNDCEFCEFRQVCTTVNDTSAALKLKANYAVKVWDFNNIER